MSDQRSKPKKAQKEKLDPAILKVALILVFGALAPLFDSTMINVAIRTLTSDLQSSVAVIQWVITGYVLTMGMAIPVSGWAVNRFGGKKYTCSHSPYSWPVRSSAPWPGIPAA